MNKRVFKRLTYQDRKIIQYKLRQGSFLALIT